ncbi:uncharacterized protein LOC111015082 [Momordica charantia]|uniref:Uncharacterized protein LOC111015082 n=1 Tax=Momordica charantia TaxID=3673 RepID=A0A6J1CVZ8_MOMCH|nr:uncharacterized protein LOC111015082 [Momordica charantia]
MASLCSFPRIFSADPIKQSPPPTAPFPPSNQFAGKPPALAFRHSTANKKRTSTLVAAVGDVSADGTTYLIAGALAVALVGTAFPILFSRKDLCPECDGAGFVRQGGAALRANAARKDQTQIVCARCNGLGKLNQVDK